MVQPAPASCGPTAYTIAEVLLRTVRRAVRTVRYGRWVSVTTNTKHTMACLAATPYQFLLLRTTSSALKPARLVFPAGRTGLLAGALQCYTRQLSNAAGQLQPAARAACADLPDRPETADVEITVETVLERGTAAGLANPHGRTAAISGTLQLAGEVVRLQELLGECSRHAAWAHS